MQLCLYDEKSQFDIRIMAYHHPITAHAQILSRRSNHFIRKLLWPPVKAVSIRRINSPVHFYSRQQDGDHSNKHTVIFVSIDSNGLHLQRNLFSADCAGILFSKIFCTTGSSFVHYQPLCITFPSSQIIHKTLLISQI